MSANPYSFSAPAAPTNASPAPSCPDSPSSRTASSSSTAPPPTAPTPLPELNITVALFSGPPRLLPRLLRDHSSSIHPRLLPPEHRQSHHHSLPSSPSPLAPSRLSPSPSPSPSPKPLTSTSRAQEAPPLPPAAQAPPRHRPILPLLSLLLEMCLRVLPSRLLR